MVTASSMSPSQMFQERTVINMSGKFITGIIFHSFGYFSPLQALRITPVSFPPNPRLQGDIRL